VRFRFPTRILARGPRAGEGDEGVSLTSFLGPLEVQVMECLWRRDGETSVRGLQEDLPGAAYTTLMTTLDRLFKKGFLERTKHGRAFRYRPLLSRSGLLDHFARGTIARLLEAAPAARSVRPILSTFVESVGQKDALLLDELEALIRAERRKGRR
jgi:predicted transcriptional regulator